LWCVTDPATRIAAHVKQMFILQSLLNATVILPAYTERARHAILGKLVVSRGEAYTLKMPKQISSDFFGD
jgi:hypothetical protein